MHNFYKREEYDLLSYFGDLGGLASVILGVGYFISQSIITRLFQAALVEKTYRWQNYEIDDTQYYNTKIAGQVTSSENSSNEEEKNKKETKKDFTAVKKQKKRAKESYKERSDSVSSAAVNRSDSLGLAKKFNKMHASADIDPLQFRSVTYDIDSRKKET